jgi:hypothetical protein
VPVVFKGSGFYCTDNGRGTSSNSSSKCEETECKPKKEAKAGAKAEAKSDSVKEAKTEEKK